MLLTGSIARRTKPQMGKAVIALAGQKQRTTTKAVSGNVISTAGIIRSIDKVTGKAECALSSTLTKLGLFWVTAGNATITPITLVKRAVNKKIENTVEYIDRLLKYQQRQ